MYLSRLGGCSRAWFAFTVIKQTISCTYLSTKMNSEALSMYEEAIYALNGLQSNARTLQKARTERDYNAFQNLIYTEKHLNALGIKLSDLDSLNIIHVAGTKGKGSTCAFIESILRKHGFKTGFFSSPHLVSVNERIRINGCPLDKNLFTRYFWEVYKTLQQSLKSDESMPHYSMFLTVMAFYVFLKEKIEATVIEVGIGGLCDCTNVIKKPVAVAVTSLGIDHVHLLGRTLPEIAAQKAGIFKPDVPAFTVPQQENAMKVLYNKAKEVNCPLRLAPSLQVYNQDINLGIPGTVQRTNASLALQTAAAWLKRHSNNNDSFEMNNFRNGDQEDENIFFVPLAFSFPIDSKFKEGLETCEWPGRFQTIEKDKVTVYLDGAHTQESMKYCVKWFQDAADRQKRKLQSRVVRILLFNCTGERKAENLLDPLSDVNFDLVVFSPNRFSVMKDSSSDQSNFMVDPEKEIQQCIINKEIWCHFMRSLGENELSRAAQSSPVLHQEVKSVMLKEDKTLLFCCLGNAVDWLIYKKIIKHCVSCDKSNDFNQLLQSADHVQILVTGSLHLVGGVLGAIQ